MLTVVKDVSRVVGENFKGVKGISHQENSLCAYFVTPE